MADTSVQESRLGDIEPAPQERRERVYREGPQWYVSTREGTPMGPFADRCEAEQALADFLEFLRLAHLEDVASLTEALTPEHAEREGAPGFH